MARKYSGFNSKEEFVFSEFDENYKFKGFKAEQVKKLSNQYKELVGQHVSDDGNNAVLKIAAGHVFKTRYGYGVIVDATHVVFIKDWQVWGFSRDQQSYIINFNRDYYQVKEYGDFPDFEHYEDLKSSDLATFDQVMAIAKQQEEAYNNPEKANHLDGLGLSFNWK